MSTTTLTPTDSYTNQALHNGALAEFAATDDKRLPCHVVALLDALFARSDSGVKEALVAN